MTESYANLLVDEQNGIVTITINRPEALNALNEQVLTELDAALSALPQSCRCVILKGAGDKAFVAGADIAAMQKMNADEAQTFARKGQKVTEKIEHLSQPTIAYVDGFALGGGCELALSCDIIVATDKAKFGQPEVHLGLIPGFGGTQRLIRRMGYSKAMELLLSGRHMSANEALDHGLVAMIASDNEALDVELNKILKGILKGAPHAIGATKALARRSLDTKLSAGLNDEAESFAICFSNGEGKEGMAAFLEKRNADFS